MLDSRDRQALHVSADSPRTRRYRDLQSRWRETVLGLPPGQHSSGRLVGSLLAESAPPDAQWLTPIIAAYVQHRVPEVQEARGTLEPDRLRRNLLSSQPLCFNLFGQLAAFPAAAARVLTRLLQIEIQDVRDVLVEHTPTEAARLLGDRSAFDAYLVANSSDTTHLIGVETKYTEPFSPKEYMRGSYRSATEAPGGWFQPGAADAAAGSATNQLWRTLLLAQLAEQTSPIAATGMVLVLTAAQDEHAETAVAGLRPLLREPDRRLRHLLFEDLVAAARQEPDLRAWSWLFHARYLDTDEQ